ncbi:MAG TPA: phosphoserine phosphatase SerB [Candidatus Methanofastidiosa archaeon]|nr:phosphoserine phosphatase SerB [Candidatus Methanofastidiosa archaeon]
MVGKLWKDDVRVLVAFDMDKTLIDCEILDEVAKEHGCFDEVAKITDEGMSGNLTFAESIGRRLMLLKGTHVNNFDKVFKEQPLTHGAGELLLKLKEEGAKTAIITGGFDIIAYRLAKKLGIDYVACNKFDINNGMLTGNFELKVDGNKDYWLDVFKKESGANVVVAVGDGANDIPMIKTADFGVAYRAKECLRGIADINVENIFDVYGLLNDLFDSSQRTCVNTSIELISE